MSETVIRPYNPETDYLGLRANLEAARLFDADYESESQLARYIADQPDNVIVATVDEEVVGSIYLQDSDIIPLLSRLTVKESHRRQGIGKRLVEAAENVAHAHGHTYVEAWVNAKNESGLKFWAAIGYVQHNLHFNYFHKIAGDK